MPVGIKALGGAADYKKRIEGLNQEQAKAVLDDVKARVNLSGKGSGTFVLVNRTKDGAQMQLQRKSGFQLFGRGSGNTRLNDTRDFWDSTLRKAGLTDAANKLSIYLQAQPASQSNRVDVSFIKDLLNTHIPDAPKEVAVAGPKPALAQGNSLQELKKNASVRTGKVLGEGVYGKVSEITIGQDPKQLVFKEFSKPAGLSASRARAHNEAIAAYLVSNKEAGYAGRAQVAETKYFAVQIGGNHQFVDSPGLRALLKAHPEGVKCNGVVMDKIAGGDGIASLRNLSQSDKKALCSQSLKSLKVLNERGFVVRDHRLENLMWSPKEKKATLIDTGTYYKVSKKHPESRFITSSLGTPMYMHARALTGAKHGPETDVYAQAMITLAVHYTGAMSVLQEPLTTMAYGIEKLGARGNKADQGLTPNDFKNLVKTTREAYRSGQAGRGAMFNANVVKNLDLLLVDMENPGTPAGFASQCLDLSNKPADDWADRQKAQEMFDQLLAHPAMK